MQTHVKTLGILLIVSGCIGLIGGFAVLALFGGTALFAGLHGERDAALAVPVIGAVGALVLLAILALSIPQVVAGAGLLNRQSWARILAIVVSAFLIFSFPFGTALGVYGLWVLLSPEGTALFVRRNSL